MRAVCRTGLYHAADLAKINTHNAEVDEDPARLDFILPLCLLQPNDPDPVQVFRALTLVELTQMFSSLSAQEQAELLSLLASGAK